MQRYVGMLLVLCFSPYYRTFVNLLPKQVMHSLEKKKIYRESLLPRKG